MLATGEDRLAAFFDVNQVETDSFLTTENREVTSSILVGATAASLGFYWGGGFFFDGTDLPSVSEGFYIVRVVEDLDEH